ncbi:MAG: ABC transporter ATP-binding protein, partial [Spirochaetaceae bacterium]
FENLRVLEDINLSVESGEFVVLLGPSGCGKSTFLSLLAGLEQPSAGTIEVMGRPLVRPTRTFGFVFQDYALFPWRTVLGNVMAGLREGDKNERKERAMFYLEKVGLEDFAQAYPFTLSGGMKQRVGIARALAYDPPILLMDEPFGALDAQTRKYMQQELTKILQDLDKTILFVTHSVIEAVYLGTRVVVFSQRPSRIVFEEKIDLEGERHYTDPGYLRYREEILHYLNRETGVHE